MHIRPRPLSWKPNRTEEEILKWRFEKEKSNVNQEPLYFTVVSCKPKISQEKERAESSFSFNFLENQSDVIFI